MPKRKPIVWMVALGMLLVVHAAAGDLFLLSQGGRIEGTLLNPDESPRQSYLIQTDLGGRLKLNGDQVARVVVVSEAEKRYEAFLPSVPDTVEGHWDVAERCLKVGLEAQRVYHLEQVLRHDPNHEEARHALGYSRIKDQWVRQQDLMEKRGYVRTPRGWRLPQEIELDQRAEQEQQRLVEWRKKLKQWSEWIVAGRGKGGEGEASIRSIREPAAAAALIELLQEEKEPRPLKLLYMDVLAGLGGDAAAVTFVHLALQPADAGIRDRSLDYLAKLGSPYAVLAFCKALQDEQNSVVRCAAEGLIRLKDPAATLPLIDALITEHKRLVGNNGMQPTFSDQGAGLNMGGGTKVVKQKVHNEAVLTALKVLHPGVDYGYDPQQWKRWYIQQTTPARLDLRRRG